MDPVNRLKARLPHLVFFIAGILVFAGCQRETEQTNDILLARVYGNELYRSDIQGFVPNEASPGDSSVMVRRYVDNWIRQQVFLHHAKQNLSPEQMNFEKRIEDYRNSLIIFAYETELVRQQLDTLVNDSQIVEYYELHQESFKLQENIVRVKYAKVSREAPEIWRLRQLYRSEDPEDLFSLEEYCIQHAATYYIDTSSWLLFQDLIREIPISAANQETYLRMNKYVELSDDYFRYFLHIVDYRLKGSVSPLVFERDNIRNILLNIRRHAFINDQRNAYLQQAVKDGSLETFF